MKPDKNNSSKPKVTSVLGLKLSRKFAKKHPTQTEKLSKHQLIYSILGLLIGFLCVIVGFVLFINGVTGSSSLTANLLGAQTEITDTAPGGVLFLIGLLIIFITRYTLKIE